MIGYKVYKSVTVYIVASILYSQLARLHDTRLQYMNALVYIMYGTVALQYIRVLSSFYHTVLLYTVVRIFDNVVLYCSGRSFSYYFIFSRQVQLQTKIKLK